MEPTTNPSPQQQNQQSDGSEINPLVVLQPGEKVICEIKRHPFGIIGQYIITGLLIITAAIVAIFVTPQLSSYNAQGISTLVYGALAVLIVFALIFRASNAYNPHYHLPDRPPTSHEGWMSAARYATVKPLALT